ncbi:MAG: hypothetical protein INR62_07600, partial [Rhodospirillales bacterium]|nr:hypothetical protein [Acetobacter sp.]
YAFFVDMTPRWHEWYRGDLGHAGGVFLHPEAVLAAPPPVFSYAAHPQGTFPLWFDPAWWTLGLKPHVWLKGHVLRLLRNGVVFLRFLLGRPEIFVLLAVLMWSGARWPILRHPGEPRWRFWKSWLWVGAPVAWGLLMFLIYLPIDFQDRYLTTPLFLVMLPLFACLQKDRAEAGVSFGSVAATTALIVLFAGIALVQMGTYLADKRRHVPLDEQHHAGYDPQIFTAAAALQELGVRPGDRLACMGDVACYTDHYWARIAGTQIEAQVDTPNESDPLEVWDGITDKRRVTAPLAAMGLRCIVSLFPNSAKKPDGWVQLGTSNFFAYPLQGSLTAEALKKVAALRPAP